MDNIIHGALVIIINIPAAAAEVGDKLDKAETQNHFSFKTPMKIHYCTTKQYYATLYCARISAKIPNITKR